MNTAARRPRIAFLDYPDVFEDFYTHYRVTQEEFATRWNNTGSHSFVRILQRCVGDVTWYEFSLCPELKEAVHQVSGCRVRFLRSPWIHRLLWFFYYRKTRLWSYPRLYRPYAEAASFLVNLSPRFLAALRKDRPDAFFVQDYANGRFDMAVLLGLWWGVPVIGWHAGSRPESYLGMWARKFTLRRASALIASSRDDVEMLVTRFGVRRERTRIILTPTDLATYRPLDAQECRRKLGLPADAIILLFVGRFDDPVKRISRMLGAIAALVHAGEDIHFVLVGGGNDEPAIRRRASRRLGNRVHFAGWIADAEMKALYYNAADALLLASVREGFPTVIGESLACGTPAVVSAVGGVPEMIVDGQTGVLIQSGIRAPLRRAIQTLLKHPGLRTSLRQNCRTLAEQRLSEASVGVQLSDCLRDAGMRTQDPAE